MSRRWMLLVALAFASPAIANQNWSEVVAMNPREGATLVEANGLLYAIGGGGNAPGYNQVWTLDPADPNPEWVLVPASGGPPPTLLAFQGVFCQHTAVFDPIGNRIIVFGGYEPTYLISAQVWALNLFPSPAWTQLSPTGTPPAVRIGHTAIYDPVRHRMIVFGGMYDTEKGLVYLDDVWELELTGAPAWEPLTVEPGPAARREAVAIYDPIGDRMVISTGVNDVGALADTWALSLSGSPAWTEIAASGPSREGAVAVYDPSGARMVLSGGSIPEGGISPDSWSLSLAGSPTWTQLSPTGSAPWHTEAAAAYDAGSDRMVLLATNGRVWSLALGGSPEWAEIVPTNAPPGKSAYHHAVHDDARHRMLVFSEAGSPPERVWSLPLEGARVWIPLTVAGGLAFSSVVYDASRDRVLALHEPYGGSAGIYEWNLGGGPAWTPLATSGTPPASSVRMMLLDSVRDRLLMLRVDGLSIDLWELALAGTPAWSPITVPGGAPYPRSGPALIYDPPRNRIVMFGGWSQGEVDELWELELQGTPQWTQLAPSGTPPSRRHSASAIYDPVRERMVVLGGRRFQVAYTNLRYLSLDGAPAWTTGPALPYYWGRSNHTAVYDPLADRMLVYGGDYYALSGFYLADTWMLDWKQPLVGVIDHGSPLALLPPWPNPASGPVRASFSLPSEAVVRVVVHDIAGRRLDVLHDGPASAGTNSIEWDLRDASGRPVRPGLYLMSLEHAGQRATRRFAVVE